MYAEVKGMENDLVQKVLAGQSPDERADELIRGSKLKDVAVRKRLAAGGLKAIEASTDPMIQLARLVDPEARRLRTIYDNQVDEPQAAGVCQNRAGAVRRVRKEHLSRRDVHVAAGVWPGEGVRRKRKADPVDHDDRRRVHARQRSR